MLGRFEVVIAEAVAELADLSEQYYRWLFSQFTALHGRDVEDHDRLVMEQRAIYGRADGA